MPQQSHGVAALDEPLALFDRLLRDIQVALAPEREPAPPAQARPRSPAPPDAQSDPEPEPPPESERPPEPEAQSEPEPSPESEPPPEPESSRGREGPLAEILERARREPPEPEPESQRAPARSGCCRQELNALGELRSSLEELRASLSELLAGYQGALVRALAIPASPAMQPTAGNEFTLVAGPFVQLEAVRAFERSLRELPGIEQVAVRGYEGADRAVVDVRLAEPNS